MIRSRPSIGTPLFRPLSLLSGGRLSRGTAFTDVATQEVAPLPLIHRQDRDVESAPSPLTIYLNPRLLWQITQQYHISASNTKLTSSSPTPPAATGVSAPNPSPALSVPSGDRFVSWQQILQQLPTLPLATPEPIHDAGASAARHESNHTTRVPQTVRVDRFATLQHLLTWLTTPDAPPASTTAHPTRLMPNRNEAMSTRMSTAPTMLIARPQVATPSADQKQLSATAFAPLVLRTATPIVPFAVTSTGVELSERQRASDGSPIDTAITATTTRLPTQATTLHVSPVVRRQQQLWENDAHRPTTKVASERVPAGPAVSFGSMAVTRIQRVSALTPALVPVHVPDGEEALASSRLAGASVAEAFTTRTVVRHQRTEVTSNSPTTRHTVTASSAASLVQQQGHVSQVQLAPPMAAPPPPSSVGLPPNLVQQLTEQVVRALDDRSSALRERQGRF